MIFRGKHLQAVGERVDVFENLCTLGCERGAAAVARVAAGVEADGGLALLQHVHSMQPVLARKFGLDVTVLPRARGRTLAWLLEVGHTLPGTRFLTLSGALHRSFVLACERCDVETAEMLWEHRAGLVGQPLPPRLIETATRPNAAPARAMSAMLRFLFDNDVCTTVTGRAIMHVAAADDFDAGSLRLMRQRASAAAWREAWQYREVRANSEACWRMETAERPPQPQDDDDG